ncbi:MAG: hypothetical protein LBB88_10825, partial [Planctomycetaceae bacterium]|nr:hypothetical protein [Planctomycetaceae bacterium]
MVGDSVVDSNKLQAQLIIEVEKNSEISSILSSLTSESKKRLEQSGENNVEKNQVEKKIESNDKAKQLFLEGANKERIGNIETAMTLYNEALKITQDPSQRFAILHRMAVINAKTKNYAESEKFFRMALIDSNANPVFLCDFAKLYVDRNQLNDAETILKNAVLAAPNDQRTLFNLGQVIAQQKDRQTEGLRYLKLALGDKLAYKELAKIYRKIGSENQAQFAEQQAMLAKDEPPKFNQNNQNQPEIPPELVEKIKQELMILEAKEIASIQDKILTDNERQLLADPLSATKNQNINQTPTNPTTHPIPSPTPTLSSTSSTTPPTVLPNPSTTSIFSVLPPPSILPPPALLTDPLPNADFNANFSSEQKNNSPPIKRIPDISPKVDPANESVNKKSIELRPINFDEINNVTKNQPLFASNQIRLIPYQKNPDDNNSDSNVVSLTKPLDKNIPTVSLSFSPNNVTLQNDRNKPSIIVTKITENEPSVRIREIASQKNDRPRQNATAERRQPNALNSFSENFRPPNRNVTENQYNQYVRRTNPLQQNRNAKSDYNSNPYDQTNNVTNNFLQYPTRNNNYPRSNANDDLPKLELVENKIRTKPKSDDESFLAFRLVSDSQPRPRLHPPTDVNTPSTKSPFPKINEQNTDQNTTSIPTSPQLSLVIHPIETNDATNDTTIADNKIIDDKITDDKITDDITRKTNPDIIPDNNYDNPPDLVSQNEKTPSKNIFDFVNKSDSAQSDLSAENSRDVIIVTENHDQPDIQINAESNTESTEKVETPIETKINNKTQSPENKLTLKNEHSKLNKQFQKDLQVQEIPEIKTEKIKEIDINVKAITFHKPQGELSSNISEQTAPKNDVSAIILDDTKIIVQEIQPKTKTEISQHAKNQKIENNVNEVKRIPIIDDKEIAGKIIADINDVDKKLSKKLLIDNSNLTLNENVKNTEIPVEKERLNNNLAKEKIVETFENKIDAKSQSDQEIQGESIAFTESPENFQLPESKSYVLWIAPTITTQKTDEQIIVDKEQVQVKEIFTNIDPKIVKEEEKLSSDSEVMSSEALEIVTPRLLPMSPPRNLLTKPSTVPNTANDVEIGIGEKQLEMLSDSSKTQALVKNSESDSFRVIPKAGAFNREQ